MRKPIEPYLVADLFPEMRAELIRILESLDDQQWNSPTACEGWSVRDVALHILGDDVGLLSNMRDHDGRHGKFDTLKELIAFINHQNEVWVQATRRMSRHLLISMLKSTGEQWAEFLMTIDPHALAGPIGWTGNDADPMWLHIARELTEYWMHHQHICEALGIESLKEARFVHPVLKTFVHALPQTYRAVDAPVDTLIRLLIAGQGGGEWHIIRETTAWKLYAGSDLEPTSTVIMDTDTAWHLFTKGISGKAARAQTQIEGSQSLGEVMLNTVAILA